MAMLNLCVQEGRIVRKPTFVGDGSGSAVLIFTIAQEKAIAPKPDGGWDTKERFFKVLANGDTAKKVFKAGDQGVPIRITGELDYNEWVDGAGAKRNETVIFAREVEFFGVFSPAKKDRG